MRSRRGVLPMKARGRGRLLVLLGVLALVAGAVLWRRMDFKRPLVAAVRNADRVHVVAQSGWGPEGEVEEPAFIIEGRERIDELLDTLDFRFSWVVSFCKCRGDTAIEFLEGRTRLAALTYHHGSHLSWGDGPWGTDVYLTPESQIRLTEWFRAQGYERLHAMRQER